MDKLLSIICDIKSIADEWVEYTQKERTNIFKSDTGEIRAVGAIHAIHAILKQIDDEKEPEEKMR